MQFFMGRILFGPASRHDGQLTAGYFPAGLMAKVFLGHQNPALARAEVSANFRRASAHRVSGRRHRLLGVRAIARGGFRQFFRACRGSAIITVPSFDP